MIPSCPRPHLTRLAFLLALFLLPTVLSAQPTRSWAVQHEGGFVRPDCESSLLDFGGSRTRNALAADAAGNVYLTGTTDAGATTDVLTVKYDSQGVVQWAVPYDGGGTDCGYAVAVDGSGNVYVAGQSWTETQYGDQGYLLVVKYNANGVQQWAAWYVGGVLSAGFAVAVDGSGNVYVAGQYYSGNSDLHSMITVKVNAAGATQWIEGAFYGYDYEESSAYDLALDSSGNAYVTGFLYKPGVDTDYLTVKYSPAGATLWTRAYETGGLGHFDQAYDVAVDGSGNAHVAGTSGVVRYSSAGTQQWVGPFNGVAHALITVGGFVYATGVSGTDIVAARYDGTGARLWSTTYNQGGAEAAYALRLVGNSLYVAGSSGADALLVAFEKDLGGASLADVYDSGDDDDFYAMAFNGSGAFWVAGEAGDDFLTVKYTVPASGPALSALTLSPAAFPGGCKTSTGTVKLTGPAPAGGAVVALSDTNPAANMPASVTVPAGATSAKFTITGAVVTSSQVGAVTASYGGVSRSATVTVRPVGVLGVAISPNPVVGPNPATGTVTLECPAPPGNLIVTLTSSNTAVANVVPSIRVPAGATTANFHVSTSDVSAVSYSTIRATANGVWKSVKLQVNP